MVLDGGKRKGGQNRAGGGISWRLTGLENGMEIACKSNTLAGAIPIWPHILHGSALSIIRVICKKVEKN